MYFEDCIIYFFKFTTTYFCYYNYSFNSCNLFSFSFCNYSSSYLYISVLLILGVLDSLIVGVIGSGIFSRLCSICGFHHTLSIYLGFLSVVKFYTFGPFSHRFFPFIMYFVAFFVVIMSNVLFIYGFLYYWISFWLNFYCHFVNHLLSLVIIIIGVLIHHRFTFSIPISLINKLYYYL